MEFHAISAAAGEGVKELIRGIADALDKIPKETLEEEDAEVAEVNEVDEIKDEEGAEVLGEQENIEE